MCVKCNINTCACPTSNDYITRCACEDGINCAVCGHYPDKSFQPEEGEKAGIEGEDSP